MLRHFMNFFYEHTHTHTHKYTHTFFLLYSPLSILHNWKLSKGSTYLYSDVIVMRIYTYFTYMFDNVLNFPNYMVKGDRIPVHVVN